MKIYIATVIFCGLFLWGQWVNLSGLDNFLNSSRKVHNSFNKRFAEAALVCDQDRKNALVKIMQSDLEESDRMLEWGREITWRISLIPCSFIIVANLWGIIIGIRQSRKGVTPESDIK